MNNDDIKPHFDVWNLEIGIVNVINIRVISRSDNDPDITNKIIFDFLKQVDHKDFNSEFIVETLNCDYDYTLTIFRDDIKRLYFTELEKRMSKATNDINR